jgi:hypothetical protein
MKCRVMSEKTPDEGVYLPPAQQLQLVVSFVSTGDLDAAVAEARKIADRSSRRRHGRS